MIPEPTLALGSSPTRFTYDGKVYFLIARNPEKQAFTLEREDPAPTLPALREAAQVFVVDDGVKYRCTLTEEFTENGRFVTARYIKNAEVKG